jgi:Flp pilus assembly protein TadG
VWGGGYENTYILLINHPILTFDGIIISILLERRNTMKTGNALKNTKNEKGISVILVAILLVALCGFVALAVDVGYMYVAKTQAQNAADACALAGIQKIYSSNSSSFTAPKWTSAQAAATEFVKYNKVAGTSLTGTDIQSPEIGYWTLGQTSSDLKPYTTTPQGKCSTSGTTCTTNANCPSGQTCLIQDIPAVKVTIKKTGNPTFFARIWGHKTFDIGASAVAARGYSLSGAGIFPFAISSCLTNDIFQNNKFGSEYLIYLQDMYPSASGCFSGQWTTFFDTAPDVPTLRKLLDGTTPSPTVKIGDKIYIQPGTETTLYKTVEDLYIGKDVYLPVVDYVNKDDAKTYQTVVAFAVFHIEGVKTNGPDKQIYGYFKKPYLTEPGSTPGGSQSNAITPPRLVN